jgi:hypothetical protein
MKAKDTKYNGYNFRSRTEARFAVLFDSIGWRYEYEPEKFELPNGVTYIPDFYLPDFKQWFEIKGIEPTRKELAKAMQLQRGKQEQVNIVWVENDFAAINCIYIPRLFHQCTSEPDFKVHDRPSFLFTNFRMEAAIHPDGIADSYFMPPTKFHYSALMAARGYRFNN